MVTIGGRARTRFWPMSLKSQNAAGIFRHLETYSEIRTIKKSLERNTNINEGRCVEWQEPKAVKPKKEKGREREIATW